MAKKEIRIPEGFSVYDGSDYLKDKDDDFIIMLLNDALDDFYKDGEQEVFFAILRDIAKARGITEIAAKTGLNREGLYKTLNRERNSRFDSIMKILQALGIKINFQKAG